MKKTALTLLFIIFLPFASDAVDPFTVRAIYFQPTDIDDPSMPNTIRDRMESVYQFYADEMDRHGFGKKTFRIETDEHDRIVVHTIKGQHNADFYGNAPKTHIAMQPELPNEFLNHKNANIFFIGGIQHYNNGTGGVALGVVFWGGGVNGGYALIPTREMRFDVVVHEVGHTFGLAHNEHRDNPDFVMGRNAGLDGLAHHEARWLDVSTYFNPNPQPINILPEITTIHPATRVHDDISLDIDVESPKGIHQVEMARVSDRAVIATHYAKGHLITTASFQFHLHQLLPDIQVWYRVIDTQGGLRQTLKDIDIPSRQRQKNPIEPPEPEPEPVEPTPEQPRFVPTYRHLTTSWARIKANH